MLSKEEIEKAKTTIRKLLFDENGEVTSYIDFYNDDDDDWGGYTMKQYAKSIDTIFEYIEQLETREQKLIEKLEKDIKEYRKEMKNTNIKLNKIYYMKRIEYAQEILELVKGEKE